MYLDSSFCTGMHSIEANGMSVFVVFSLILMPVFACAIVAMVARIVCSATHMRDGHGKRRSWIFGCMASLHDFTTPIWMTWSLLGIMIIAPYVYFSVAEPCVQCFDFESSMVHYVGEVLGLSDPQKEAPLNGNFGLRDYMDNLNVTRTRKLDSFNCAGIALLAPTATNALVQIAEYNETGVGTGSVMLTPSKVRAERCPTLDDVRGLNLLYPTCEYTQQTEPQCSPPVFRLGLTRFSAVVVAGLIVSFLVILVVSWTTTWCLRQLSKEEDAAVKKEAAGGMVAAYPPIDATSHRAEYDLDPSGSRAPMHRI